MNLSSMEWSSVLIYSESRVLELPLSTGFLLNLLICKINENLIYLKINANLYHLIQKQTLNKILSGN